MAHNIDVPLALSTSRRARRSAPRTSTSRATSRWKARASPTWRSGAGMSKQAMGDLVDQCEAWGLVTREPDPRDARARLVRFTSTGLAWLQAFKEAVAQAEAEFRAEVGPDVATVVTIGLEAYAGALGMRDCRRTRALSPDRLQ